MDRDDERDENLYRSYAYRYIMNQNMMDSDPAERFPVAHDGLQSRPRSTEKNDDDFTPSFLYAYGPIIALAWIVFGIVFSLCQACALSG